MATPLDYASVTPDRPPDAVHAIAALVIGSILLLLGISLFVFTWDSLQGTDSPGYSWGPGQYVFGVLQMFVWVTVFVMAVATMLVLIGIRRVRRVVSGRQHQ